MKKGNKVVFGLFDSRSQIEAVVDSLKSSGFRHSDISVLMPEMGDTGTLAHDKASKAPEGAAVGTGTGAVLGGALGWLVGAGAIAAVPFLGPLVAVGPILSTLVGLGVGGAVGSLTGALIGYGIPEYEAKRYETFVKEGGILLSVHVDDQEWQEKARNILETSGGHDISSSQEAASDSDVKTTDAMIPPVASRKDETTTNYY